MSGLTFSRGVGAPAKCRSCGASIIFAFHPTTKKHAPFQPDTDGQWEIENGTARFVGSAEVQLALGVEPPKPRYTSHFSTCPEAQNWRKR